jgi:hypothetical protein
MRITIAALGLIALAACGDDAPPPVADAAPDDAVPVDAADPDAAPHDAAPDDAAPGDATPDDAAPGDATPDDAATVDAARDATVDAAPVDADLTSPIITDVETSTGSSQVRQFSTVTLVITGDRLAAATSVIVGAITTPIVTRADTQLTVSLAVPHGHAEGAFAVTVTTPDGVVTAPDAITITHFIVATTTLPGGRGTYDSPITLCDPVLATATAGDTVELLPGTHTCDQQQTMTGGFRMVGAGTAQTIVDSHGWELHAATGETLIANLTLHRSAVILNGRLPRLTFRDVAATTSLVWSYDDAVVTFERVTVTGAALVQAERDGSVVAIDVEVIAPPAGRAAIELETGNVSLQRTTIRGFAVGVAITEPAQWGGCSHSVALTDSAIVDATVGVQVFCGRASLTRSRIVDDPLTAAVTTIGVDIDKGNVSIRDSSRLEVSQHAIRTSNADCGDSEHNSYIDVADSVVIGGSTGIDHDSCEFGRVTLRRSVVRGGTIAVGAGCFGDQDCPYDLSGGNDLQVTSPTGHALLDSRYELNEFAPPINMVGSTLNGRSYAGQRITGPAQITPDYRLLGDGTIQF